MVMPNSRNKFAEWFDRPLIGKASIKANPNFYPEFFKEVVRTWTVKSSPNTFIKKR